MLLPPGQKHFTVYVVSSLFGSVSVLYAVLKNSNCNRSSYFTLKWSSFTTAALYLLCLYLRYTQSHLTGCIYFFKFRRQIFFWLCPGVKSISWVLFQGSLFLPHRNTSPLLQALGFLALLIRNAQPIVYTEFMKNGEISERSCSKPDIQRFKEINVGSFECWWPCNEVYEIKCFSPSRDVWG